MAKPTIRFKGYTDDWEQRKLGDLVDRVTRKNQDLVSELPLTISAQYGLIDQNEFFDKRVASKDVSGYYLIENGEFAYNKSTSTDAPWGAIKRLDRYENGVLSTLYIVFGIKENNPVDSDFLVSYYSTNLWHKGIHEIAAEGARNHGLLNIAPADFFETKLMIPQDIEEQKKIGKYFEELERLITLHQRITPYFLKINAFVWEQRKVSEMFKVTRGYVLPATETSEEMNNEMPYPVYSSQTKDNGLMGYYGDYLYEDAITWTTDGANAGTVNFRAGKFYCTNVCGVLLSDKIEASKAVAEALNSVAKKYVSYVGNPKLMNNVMAEIQISVPSSKEERDKISSFFGSLDHLITLHQRKPYFWNKFIVIDWEQRNLGEITELKSASRVHKDEWTSNGVPFYRSSDVMAAINGTENEKAFISEELYEKLSKVSGKLEEGDILVTGGGSVGNPYIVLDNKPLYTKDADLLWIKNKGKFHPYFLYEFFFSPTFRNYLRSISHVGTIAHYTITQLSDTPIYLPSFEEQKEVGEYFQSLDHLITLHQRKCEELQKIKKFMLQNMFV